MQGYFFTSGGRQLLPAHSHSLLVWFPAPAKPEKKIGAEQ